MYLAHLTIKNFRGIKSGEVSLLKHSVLLGSNNSGKSSIMDAVGYLLGRDRMIRNLGDYDFFGGDPAPQDRIVISGLLTGFASDDPAHYPEWFNTMSGGSPCWFDEKSRKVGNEPDNPGGLKLGVRIAFAARFDEDDLDYESVRYFVDAETDPFEDVIVKLNAGHLKELGFFLIPSKRNWERTISFGSDLFKKVVKFQNAIPSRTVLKTRDALRKTPDRIENEEPFKSIVQRIDEELRGFMDFGKDGLNFIPTTGDVEGVLQSLTPHIFGSCDVNIPLGNHGSGLVSLQTLLLLMEFGRYRHEKGSNFILGAEEPELHLQPGLHRRLVSRIRGLSDQSILTTHSPEIASYYLPSEIGILRNSGGLLKVIPLLQPDESIPDKNAIMRLYTIYRSEICEALMNRIVLLPEGLTEYFWFKSLIGSLITADGWHEGAGGTISSHVGILPTQDSNIENTYLAFSPLIDRIFPIVDGDKAGNDYINALLKLKHPPLTILQLPKDWDIEKSLAWIVAEKLDKIPAGLQYLLSGPSLYDSLVTNKTNWRIHESVLQFVVGDLDCLERARKFIGALCNAAADLPDSNWSRDARSTDSTNVLVFSMP